MNRISALAALCAALLLAACEPTPDPDAPKTSPVAQQQVDPAYVHNPLLDAPPPLYLSVIGDCGKQLFEDEQPGDVSACLAGIRERAKAQGLGDLTDAQLADMNVRNRWRHEQSKLQKAAEASGSGG
ncbi:hypothetical protein [Chitiniphilus eburneus]|uniref:Lipoprotein n=1 Tax=Chitiniphilus eburneus TaxID=2571148 RepID=A0A4U0PLK8_9NEIS|nr:hypothetical protein [Chitiniphilus eburneus]TJZ69031.1 hypothetical protein FAZ21_15305 [Chitiniphilus eburneus]